MVWFEKYNWKENVFFINPDPENFVGQEEVRDSLIQSVKSNNICFVHGKVGSGKSTLLLWLERFGLKDFTTVYINGIEQKFSNELLEDMILSKRNFWEKILRRWPKNVVILADECQAFNKEFLEFLKAKFDNKTFISIILGSPALLEEIQVLTDSFKDRIGYKSFELKPLSETELNELISKRLEGLNNPFNIDVLKLIFEESNFFPRKVLENCQKVCEQLNDINVDTVKGLFKKTTIEPIIRVKASETDILKGLTEEQSKIISLLTEKPLTSKEIAESVNKSVFWVGSQITRLQLKDKDQLLTKKGFDKPLVKKLDTKPVSYTLESDVKSLFAKE
jgi:hypothetical protein